LKQFRRLKSQQKADQKPRGVTPLGAKAWPIRAPQSPQRARELQTAILAQRAVGAYERGRYVDALMALDRRARIASERNDLIVLRGYAYLKLSRMADAEKVFCAVAATGNRDAKRGLAEVNEMLESAR
jgi:thioredoxin-like negative regulator of GroEL